MTSRRFAFLSGGQGNNRVEALIMIRVDNFLSQTQFRILLFLVQDFPRCSVFLLFLTFAFWRVYFQRREREIQQKLDEKEENAVEIKGNYTSLQQEVDSKTKKLKKVNLF